MLDKLLIKHGEQKAFEKWCDDIKVETPNIKVETCSPDHGQVLMELSDMHRIYWAIKTRRYDLMEELWISSSQPLIAAFFIQ